jgi:hypothetical protein
MLTRQNRKIDLFAITTFSHVHWTQKLGPFGILTATNTIIVNVQVAGHYSKKKIVFNEFVTPKLASVH